MANISDRERNWLGPLANQMYYNIGDSPQAYGVYPAVGDTKVELDLSGQISIDNQDTPDGSDDLISGVIVIEEGTRNVLTGNGNASRVEESWSSLTQTLASTPVDSATPNDVGGFDYVIATRGMPEILQPIGLNNEAYPSEIASSPIASPAVSGWFAPDSEGRSVATFECDPESPTPILATWNIRRNRLKLSSPLGAECADPNLQNIGATTTGVFTDWTCENSDGDACPNNAAILGAPISNAGYQNLLIAISTDADGYIVSSNAFYTNEYQVLQFLFGFQTPYEAWDGGILTMAGIVQEGSVKVRPCGDSPNINIKSRGKISVVLYSNANLDATQVTNITFGPATIGIAHKAPHIKDMNDDGLEDLVMHFVQKETGISCGDTSAVLNAETSDGIPFSATATINVVGCK